MKSTHPHLSVVIPAFNEAANFKAGVLTPVFTFLNKQKFTWEVIIVDDGSTDSTFAVLQQFSKKQRGCKVLHIKHGGKAFAVQAGVLAAKGDIVLFTDFDQSTPLRHVLDFMKAHKRGFAMVIGVRHASTKTITEKDTYFRRFRSWVFVTIVKFVLQVDARDTQCGFKSFTAASAKKLFTSLPVTTRSRETGAYMGAFDVELLYQAKKNALNVTEVPVSWVKIESTRLNAWREPVKMLMDVFRMRLT